MYIAHSGKDLPLVSHPQQNMPPLSIPLSDFQQNLNSLKQIFPTHSHQLLVRVLKSSNGDVGHAAEAVLNGLVPEEADGDDDNDYRNQNEFEQREGNSDTETIDISENKVMINSENLGVVREKKEKEKQSNYMEWIGESNNTEKPFSDEVNSFSAGMTSTSNANVLKTSSQSSSSPIPPADTINVDSVPTSPSPPPLTMDIILAEVLSIFPDCCTEYIKTLYEKHKHLKNDPDIMNTLVGSIMETKGKYPKQMMKRKREEGDDGDEDRKPADEKPDWDYERVQNVPGLKMEYYASCKKKLLVDFPTTPETFIKSALTQNHNLYTPTHAYLTKIYEDNQSGTIGLPFKPLMKHRKLNKKDDIKDVALLKELRFMRWKIAKKNEERDLQIAEKLNEEQYEAEGALIECGCCFCEYTLDKMVQCDDGHLFCMECARRNAEEQIGLRRTVLKCFDQSQCKYTFPLSEIKRFLPQKTFECFMNVVQTEDIRNAELEGFHSCPFCDFGAIIENEEDKEFLCGNPRCGERTCRKCKEKSHLPLSCEENSQDNRLSLRHKVEEAMTLALLRECPKCQRKFYKTEGCNKMTCTCGQHMCYVCRKPINNYDHFNGPNGCPLRDNTEQRNADDVVAAAKEATAQVQLENPLLELDDINEEIKKGADDRILKGLAQGAPAGIKAPIALNPIRAKAPMVLAPNRFEALLRAPLIATGMIGNQPAAAIEVQTNHQNPVLRDLPRFNDLIAPNLLENNFPANLLLPAQPILQAYKDGELNNKDNAAPPNDLYLPTNLAGGVNQTAVSIPSVLNPLQPLGGQQTPDVNDANNPILIESPVAWQHRDEQIIEISDDVESPGPARL